MSERLVACIDLDQTLTGYDGQLRPGAEEVLGRFQRGGIANVLTTAGKGFHLRNVFASTGIERYFAGVFDGDTIDVGMGKLYGPVAKALGHSSQEAPHKMIVTGDQETDQPADLPLVFIYHPAGFRHDASLLERIIQGLRQLGNDSFIEGFNAIKRRQNRSLRGNTLDLRTVGIGSRHDGEILATLSFEDPTLGGKTLPRFTPGIIVPTLKIVSAEGYKVVQATTRKVRLFG